MKLLPQAGNNSFSRNALFIFLIRFFPSLANVLIIIIFSRQLSKEVYGIYQNFWVQLLVLNTVACLGFQAFIVTYAPSFITTIYRKLAPQHFAYFLTWVAIISAAFCYLQSGIPGLSPLVPFVFLFVYSLSTVAESVLISFRKFALLLVINKVYTLIFFALHLLLLDGYSFDTLFAALLIPSALRLLILGVAARKELSLNVPGAEVAGALDQAKKLWMHIGVYDVSQMLFKWIDKFIISLLFVEAVSAVYFNGSLDIPFLPLLLGAASSSALIQLANTDKTDNTKFTVALANHSSRILSSIVFPVFFFFLFYRYELFAVLLSEKYVVAVPIFFVSVMAMPLRAYSFTTILQNRHKGAIINTGALGDLLVACALMYPLYLVFDLPGIALSFVISSYLQAAYYLYQTSTVLNVGVTSLLPWANWLVKLVIFAVLLFAVQGFTSARYTPEIVLIWGAAVTFLMLIITLWVEFKTSRR